MSELRWMSRLVIPCVLAALLSGCPDAEPPPEMEAEISRLQAERDSLEAELSEVDRRAEDLRTNIQQIELPEGFLAELDEPPRTAADTLRALATRAETAEAGRSSAEARAWTLQQRVDSLHAVHAEAVEAYESQLEAARDTIGDLAAEIDRHVAEIDRLEGEIERLRSAVEELEGTLGTAHYVVGTREELLQRGVVREAGGARFLGFLWKRGEVLVPERDLDRDAFETLDLREDREIPLPRSDVFYQIISRHDPDHLGPDVAEDGSFRGDRLQIRDPEGFWASSRFLIILDRG